MWTKRTIAAVAVSSLAIAGVAGVAVANDADQVRARDQIQSWVEEGTITQTDADAFERVIGQMQEQRQQHREEQLAQREQHQAELAAAAGVTTEQLRERLRDGESLADIAGDNADAVRELLTTRAQERLAEAQASIDERVEALMNRQGHGFGDGFGPGRHGDEFGFGPGGHGGGHGMHGGSGAFGAGAGAAWGPGPGGV
jgi:hypothetical protein